jgi:hypothetical protein
MSLDDIRALVSDGFQPFELRTTSGRDFRVLSPASLTITKRSVVVEDEDGFAAILLPSDLKEIRRL